MLFIIDLGGQETGRQSNYVTVFIFQSFADGFYVVLWYNYKIICALHPFKFCTKSFTTSCM